MTICNDIILDWNTLNKKHNKGFEKLPKSRKKRVCF